MSMDAMRCPNGHVSYPVHPLCPKCGEAESETIDLSDRTGEIVTWTESTATPPGVREPNVLAFVEFEVDGQPVRALGGVADNADIETGDAVEPVYVEELREPGVGLKPVDADQEWDGYRFRPIE